MSATNITWTNYTINPVIGCSRISPGCAHCYAEASAPRCKGFGTERYAATIDAERRWNGKTVWVPEAFSELFKITKQSFVFVCSMGDLFHETVSTKHIKMTLEICSAYPWLTFQLLTKRSHRLAELASDLKWPENVWQGVTVEDRKHLNRLDDLRKTPATIRFVSFEPLLEDLGSINLAGIHWAIVGGESGKGCRPMNLKWVENIERQCKKQGVAFFFKQEGGYHGGSQLWKGKTVHQYPCLKEVKT